LVPGRKALRLSSIGYPSVWPPKGRMQAECMRKRCSTAPGDGCNCGIHALAVVHDVLNAVPLALWPPLVVGRVALWGRVVPGTRGWRAQFAYPSSLMVVERWPWRCKRLPQLESAYGVSATAVRWRDVASVELETQADVGLPLV
jgi:hypothetical protein